MTKETRTLVEITDIDGLDFECPKCGTRITYPLATFPREINTRCPGCPQDWFVGDIKIPGNPTYGPVAIAKLVEALQDLPNRADIHAHVRLHMRNIE